MLSGLGAMRAAWPMSRHGGRDQAYDRGPAC